MDKSTFKKIIPENQRYIPSLFITYDTDETIIEKDAQIEVVPVWRWLLESQS